MRYIRCFFTEEITGDGSPLKYRQAFFSENRLGWFEQTEKKFDYIFPNDKVEQIRAVDGYVDIDGWERLVLIESIRGIPKFFQFGAIYPLSTDDWRENVNE